MTTNTKPIPVTIITGFLGSGKTTLLNRMLTQPNASRMAVIQNEFGEIGIDHELIVREEDGIFEMQNGCLCCTVRDDLIRILETLRQRTDEFDRILIETTGLADPVPVAQTFFSSVLIQKDFQLDGIVTLADAANFFKQYGTAPETHNQILCADLILLNKVDAVESAEVERVEKELRNINPDARILRTTNAEVDSEQLFSISLLKKDIQAEIEKSFDDSDNHAHAHEHHHHTHTHAHAHTHDELVGSLSLEIEGEMDLERLDAWMNMLTMLQGNHLYRMKGLLNLGGEERLFVFQAVFSMLQGNFGRLWKNGEKRTNKFVFIGKNLNKQLLEDGFKACLVQAQEG